MHARALTAAITAMITIAALTPAAAAAPTENQPVVPVDDLTARPAAVDAGAGASWRTGSEVVRQSAGPPALARKLRRVLPTLRRMPVGTSIERVLRGDGERCPGVRAEGPRAVATAMRSFSISDTESHFVQAVAFARSRQAQRALDTWFRQSIRDCRRFTIDDFTLERRRTRPPIFGLGDARRAFRTRFTYDDPTVGRFHAAEQVTVAYREGRYLLLVTSTGLLRFLGDTPKPNFNRWADSIEYMFNRADNLPR